MIYTAGSQQERPQLRKDSLIPPCLCALVCPAVPAWDAFILHSVVKGNVFSAFFVLLIMLGFFYTNFQSHCCMLLTFLTRNKTNNQRKRIFHVVLKLLEIFFENFNLCARQGNVIYEGQTNNFGSNIVSCCMMCVSDGLRVGKISTSSANSHRSQTEIWILNFCAGK